jgi:hypothetical protein
MMNRNSSVLSDEDIELSHSVYFTWGYPDYVRQAFRLLQDTHSPLLPPDPDKEMTWSQLRKALEAADSSGVRYIVAGNPNTPQNVLDFLSKTGDKQICRRIAENSRTHPSTLSRLARHEAAEVRIAVCENIHTPGGTLLQLTADSNPDVRYAMADCSSMPQTVLQVLSNDENPYVSARARASLQTLTNGEVLAPDFSRVARRRIGRAAW